MNILDPDAIMNEMQSNPNPPYEQILGFIKKEAESFIALKKIIEDCDNSTDFMNNLDLMIELSNNIRTDALDTLFRSYKVYHFKKKKMLTNLRTYIKR